jgi:drug/metabolite transporter superfamily protein YnfA
MGVVRSLLYVAFYIALAYYSYLMLLITLQYVPIDFQAAFLRVKQDEIQLSHYQIAFFTHVYSSMFVLISGAFQFIPWLRNKHPKLHQYSGYIYLTTLLLLSAPSGIIMGIYANGGIYSKISFVLLGVLWIVFTLISFQAILKKNWLKHQKFMIRSYALTLSALSLRLIKWIIISVWALPPMDTYKIVAWLGWVVNLIIAEIVILILLNRKNIAR